MGKVASTFHESAVLSPGSASAIAEKRHAQEKNLPPPTTRRSPANQ
jgi:hypothetical protein